MQAINQIGIYQLENLIMQRVPFTLLDLTSGKNLITPFEHLNPYYLNFFKAQILTSNETDYKLTEKFQVLAKDAPVIVICDTGKESFKIANELESAGYINVFYVLGGADSLKAPLPS